MKVVSNLTYFLRLYSSRVCCCDAISDFGLELVLIRVRVEFVYGAVGLRFESLAGQTDTMWPTARHRCSISCSV